MDKPTTPLPVCEIMGVRISVTDMPQTVRCIREHLESWRGRYICVSNVHTTVTAYGDPAYRDVQNGAVLALPEKYRLPVHLFYYEGYSIKEAAAILGRREGTVRAQLTRARAMLRDRLEAERT